MAVGRAAEPPEQQEVWVSVGELRSADSPRLGGECAGHVQILAETDEDLPPILVHRSTMRVIDGMHRLRAAVLRGDETVRVRYFDGDVDAAFVRAVESNIAHGLPLSRADREAAAVRIIAAHADWSDRAVAASTGLSGKTVGAIRRRTGSLDGVQAVARVGRDGRVRPLNGAAGRQRASELIAARPEASLREIAAAAGISPATARDVRERLRRGDDPVLGTLHVDTAGRTESLASSSGGGGRTGGPVNGQMNSQMNQFKQRVDQRVNARDREAALQSLRRDPSLRFTESGRSLLRWLDAQLVGSGELSDLVATVPAHRIALLTTLARDCAASWTAFADKLDNRRSSA